MINGYEEKRRRNAKGEMRATKQQVPPDMPQRGALEETDTMAEWILEAAGAESDQPSI